MYDKLINAIVNNNVIEAQALISSMSLSDLSQLTAYNSELDSYMSPLHMAAFYGRTDIVNALIEKGVEINQPTREVYGYGQTIWWALSFTLWSREGKYTALHLAAKKSHQAVIRKLIASRANYSLKDLKGNLPLTFDQLCSSIDSSIKKVNFSMYSFGNISLERLKLLFLNSSLEDLEFGKIECLMESDDDVYFTLLETIRHCTSLKALRLNMSFIINTHSGYGFLHESSEDLDDIRKIFIKIINATLEFVKNQSSLEFISVGKLIQHHEDSELHTRIENRTSYSGSMQTVNVTERRTDTTDYKLLSFTHDSILHVAANPEVVKKKLLEDTKQQAERFDVIRTLFQSKPHDKLYDPDVFISACVLINKILLDRKSNSLSGQEPRVLRASLTS